MPMTGGGDTGGIGSFLRLSWSARLLVLRRKLRLPVPLLVRLPDAGWWIAWNDYRGDRIWLFEPTGRAFVRRFLERGMTVFDLGAHVGIYSLIASRQVGPSGRVFSFEPSPRELRRLKLHLWLNRATNVRAFQLAVGEASKSVDFWVSLGRDTGWNSLHHREGEAGRRQRRQSVEMTTLDDFVPTQGIQCVDFIKMDVEEAELRVIQGATELLRRHDAPVVMAEMWRSRDVYELLADRFGFTWFSLGPGGALRPCPVRDSFGGCNLVAVPQSRLPQVEPLFEKDGCSGPRRQ